MRRALLAAITIGLAAAGGTAADAAALPDRAGVQAALDAWLVCADATEPTCRPPPRILLSASRCWPDLPGPGREGRVICLFSGLVSGGRGPVGRFDKTCVYLTPEGPAWRFVAIVDEDICAEYRGTD